MKIYFRPTQITVFTTKFEYRPIIYEVRASAFKEAGHLPASRLSSLADPDWLVEIKVIAGM